jgi:predicted phage-related endonuclease
MTVKALDSKRVKVGGSTIAAIVGLDPYLSPIRLAWQLLGELPSPQSEVMRNGLRLEEAHRDWLEDDGYTILPAPADGFVHPEHEWAVCHPDGFILLDKERGVLEMKLRGVTPDDRLRVRDTLQLNWNLGVTGLGLGLVSTVHGGVGGIVRDEFAHAFERDLFDAQLRAAEKFRALVLKGKLPEPEGSKDEQAAIRDRFGVASDATVRLSTKGYAAVKEYRTWREQKALCERKMREAAAVVQLEMGEASVAISPHDDEVAKWTSSTRRTIDAKALREQRPQIAELFETVTETRRFSVT